MPRFARQQSRLKGGRPYRSGRSRTSHRSRYSRTWHSVAVTMPDRHARGCPAWTPTQPTTSLNGSPPPCAQPRSGNTTASQCQRPPASASPPLHRRPRAGHDRRRRRTTFGQISRTKHNPHNPASLINPGHPSQRAPQRSSSRALHRPRWRVLDDTEHAQIFSAASTSHPHILGDRRTNFPGLSHYGRSHSVTGTVPDFMEPPVGRFRWRCHCRSEIVSVTSF